ncbi:MAG TPA: kelch repeat-containing protein, partial [Candidatus Binatia bacterium]
MNLHNARKALCLSLALVFGYSATGIAQVVSSAQLNVARRGHTATGLQDGKVVVVGGENAGGTVGAVELFDPATRAFSSLAASVGRTDHTATLLPDGRVLVAGGRDGQDALDSTQIFNPLDNTFSAGPSLQRARSGHSATLLADGRVLLVGGDAAGSAEIFDAAAQLSTLTGSLAEPRALHGAAALKDGRVLIAGGVDAADATQVLDSAEIFDPQTGVFSSAWTTMGIARALPTLRVLPDGKVQVIGGDASYSMEIFDPATGGFNAIAMLPPIPEMLDATLTTEGRAALINPAIAQHPVVGSLLTPDDLALLDRADQTITEIPGSNQALVAGGVNSAGQVLDSAVLVSSSPAKITTDQTDYAPGTPVVMTGSGFLPNEQVNISLDERPDAYTDPSYVVTTDDQGSFTFTGFAPAEIDLNRTFVLTAIGQSSGYVAQTTFHDAVVVTAQSVSPTTATVNVSTVFTVSATFSGGGTAPTCDIDWGDATAPSPGVITGSTCSFSGSHTYTSTG